MCGTGTITDTLLQIYAKLRKKMSYGELFQNNSLIFIIRALLEKFFNKKGRYRKLISNFASCESIENVSTHNKP